MTLEECYNKFGGDYKLVLSRLMMDKIVDRFIRKFLDDPSYNLLISSLNDKNYEEAFRAAHTLKGLCLNLCLDGLLKKSVSNKYGFLLLVTVSIPIKSPKHSIS